MIDQNKTQPYTEILRLAKEATQGQWKFVQGDEDDSCGVTCIDGFMTIAQMCWDYDARFIVVTVTTSFRSQPMRL